MHRIDAAGYAAGNLFTDGNPSTGTPATVVNADWLNDLQENVAKMVESAGIVLSKGDYTQLLKAIVTKGLQGCYFNIGSAAGTADAITSSYTPAITALENGMTLYVCAASANATTTPTFTPNSGTIAAKTIVKGAGAALAAGDIAGGGHWIELQYNATLDKWVLLNPATGVTAAAAGFVQGAFKNLQASATGLSANVSVTVDEIAVESAANAYQTLRSVNLTIAGTSSGVANGLDTGALAINTWYSVWVIWNGTSTAGLLSLSATAPTMPTGYTHKARVGWIRTDGTVNKYPLPFTQKGKNVTLSAAPGTNLTALPLMASGTASANTSVGTANFVPPTAKSIDVIINNTNASTGATTVSPNQNFGSALWSGSGLPPPPITLYGYNANSSTSGRLLLEGSNIYWGAGSTSYLMCYGWEDI